MAAENLTVGKNEKATRKGTSGKAGQVLDSIQEVCKNSKSKTQNDNIPSHPQAGIERELMESKERRQVAEISEMESDRLKNILDSVPDAAYIVRRDGTIEYVNPKMERENGPWTGVKCYQYRTGNDSPCPSCKFEDVQSGATVRSEWIDGRTDKIYDCIDAPLKNPDGSISKLKIMRDVTGRRKTTEKIERQNAVLEAINSILTKSLNCETEEELGQMCLTVAKQVTQSEFAFIGEIGADGSLHDIAISDPDWEMRKMYGKSPYRRPSADIPICDLYGRALRERKAFFINAPVSHPDSEWTSEGHPPITSFLGVPLLQKGQTIGIAAVANREGGYDHRQRQALEAISATIVQVFSWFRAEEALSSSEEEFHGLFHTMSEAFVLFELVRDDSGKAVDCRILDANPALETMTGVPPDDVIGHTMREIFPDSDDFWFETYGKVEATGKPASFDRHFKPLDRFYHTTVYRPVLGRVAIIFTDITERKRAEDLLHKTKEELERYTAQLQATFDSLAEGLVISDLDGSLFHWNPAALEMHGFTSMDECRRKLPELEKIFELSTENGCILPLERWPLARILSGETLNNWEVNLKRHGTNWRRTFSYGGTLARDKDGKPLLAVVTCVDITERKHAAEQIQRLAKFPSENPFPVLRIASSGTILYSNKPGLSLLTERNKRVGQNAPDDWQEWIAQAMELNQNIIREVSSGDRIFSVVLAPIVEGEYVNLYGRDITAERWASQALRKAHAELEKKVEQRTAELAEAVVLLRKEVDQRTEAERTVRERSRVLDAFFSHTITPLVILDKDFNFVRVNRAYADGCEREISDFEGHNHFEFYPHEENRRIFENVVRTRKRYETKAKPFSFPDHPEWGVTYWDWTLVPILDESGEVELLVLSLEDVTARKRSELALEQSEAHYRALIESSPDPVSVVAEEKVVFANLACLKLAGVQSADELVGKQVWEFVQSDSSRVGRTMLRAVLRGRRQNVLSEVEVVRPDGRTVHVEVSAAPVRYEAKPAVQVVIRDITDRKESEVRDRVTKDLLKLFVQKTSKKDYLDSVVRIVRTWSGCRCIGIRLKNSDGHIPYESCIGFSEEFLSLEADPCLSKDSCACIRVINQQPDPQDCPMMTTRGSFRCGSTTGFVGSLNDAEKERYRGACVRHGFESVAVVPICYRDQIFGAIYVADEQENKVPPEKVKFLENMAALVGEAVHRFHVEDALRLSESRLVDAQRIAHVGNWDLDIVENSLWWSDEVYRIFGLEPQQFDATYEAFLSCVHPEDREPVRYTVNEALNNRKPYDINHRVIRPDGSERIVHEQAEVLYNSEGRAVRMMGTIQDITEYKRAEQRIMDDQAKLRSLTSELQLAEERERRRLARDLHDSIGQLLAMSKREVYRLRQIATPEMAGSLEEVAQRLDQAVEESRTLSFELSPSVLYDLGFEVALEDLADRFSSSGQIDCKLLKKGGFEPMGEAMEVLLYRSVRELLINVIKHADAKIVEISLETIENKVYITVSDDGDGFDVSILESPLKRPKGFGVMSIRERLKHVGGQFDIQSETGCGTKVTLIVPTDIQDILEEGGL